MTASGELISKALRLLAPPTPQTVSEWADEFRILSSEGAAAPGRWRTDRAPYQREVMDAYNDPTIHTIVWMKSSQVGATEAINNILAYAIHRKPGPIMVVQPTVEMAKAWSKDRLEPLIRDTPVIRDRVFTRRSSEGGSNVLYKAFPGGHCTMTGANSPATLASRPIRDLHFDEVDRAPTSAGEEGDPVGLAAKRTTTFHDRKIIMTSTPTIAGRSRIEAEFNVSDQRYYIVPCPRCGVYDRLSWDNIRYTVTPSGEATDVYYECPHCKGHIEHREKKRMLREGGWSPTKKPEVPGVAGFHISELYSPFPNATWTHMASAYIKAKKEGKDAMRVFVNTGLGLPYRDHEVSVTASEVEERAERYETGVPPDTAVLLTAAVDVQADRLEIEVKGWGHSMESWALVWHPFYGDPTRPQIWTALERFVKQEFVRPDGVRMRIKRVCVDSGYLPHMVYRFCNPRWPLFVATKGSSQEGAPLVGRLTKQKNKGQSCRVLQVGTSEGKDWFYSNLKTRRHGPGYQHYPQGFDTEFFEQLTSETREDEFSKKTGKRTKRYVQTRRRNEALDLEVLNLVAYALEAPDTHALERALDAPEAPPEAPPKVDLSKLTRDLRRKRRT